MPVAKSHWLLVERVENWTTDYKDGFRQFGLPDSKKTRGSEIKTGDLLIFYISSGISSFADIREAQEDGVSKLRLGGDYDTAFPWRVKTNPVLTLPQERWVSIKPLISELSFTVGKADWRQVMRNSLRRLSEADASIIIMAMRKASKKVGKE